MNSQEHQVSYGMVVQGNVGGTGTSLTGGGGDTDVEHVYRLVTDSSSASTTGLANTYHGPAATMRGRSRVWSEFTVTPDGKKVTCHRCGDCLSYSNSHSTSSMLKHLKRKHNLDLYPTTPVNDEGNDAGNGAGQSVLSDTGYNQPNAGTAEKRVRTGLKKALPKDGQEADKSIQHGPLVFKDPCVRMKWTDHSDTFLRSFSSLYSDQSYTDVTIVVEKQFFKAHRIILSSASEFFDETFKMTPSGQHPIIFLKDTKAIELRVLLDFIYKGEVSIPPSLIPSLVKVGSELRVRGLSDFVWNDQLTNSVNLKQQQTQSAMAQSAIPFQKIQSQPTVASTASKGQIFIRQQQHATPVQNTPSARTYSRVLNIRPTSSMSENIEMRNVLTNTTSLQGRSIGNNEVGAVCSTVGSSVSNMKRIRIVSSESRQASQIRATGNNDKANPRMENSHLGSETVLMVTNEGETLLSTSQGGVTILSNPSSSALSLGNDYDSSQQHMEMEQDQQLKPVITSITSHAVPTTQSSSESCSDEGAHELGEVVYCIDEISDKAPRGDDDEVLLDNDDAMRCDSPTDNSIDKKPYMS